jgi:hypothetical protein
MAMPYPVEIMEGQSFGERQVCEYEHVRDFPAFKLHGLPDWITSRAILYIHLRGVVRYKA